MANISFGERVRRARIRNAMSQSELGKKLGVVQTTISNWEKDKPIPNDEQKTGIKGILGNVWTEAATSRADTRDVPGPSVIGSWLTRARLEKKYSVPELATKTGLSATAIYNIESGRISNPRQETIVRLETALKTTIPKEAKVEIREEATIEGVGELIEFDPHDDEDLPAAAGIYVLYDISERPIYVGQGQDIRGRLLEHADKFWFKRPIVETAAYVNIEAKPLREKVEKLMIRFLKSNAVINKQNVDR